VTFKDPSVPIIANVTAQPLTHGSQIKDELLKQLCSSVQWQRSVEYMVENGVGKFIRNRARKVLAGLVKRNQQGIGDGEHRDVNAVKGLQ